MTRTHANSVIDRGFTLVELAVVLAVVAILATVVVPDFIEIAREDLVQKAAKDIAAIHDAAQSYHHRSLLARGGSNLGQDLIQEDYNGTGRDRIVNAAGAIWPGQRGNDPNDCATGSDPIAALEAEGFLRNEQLNPPWGPTGSSYRVNIAGRQGACNLVVSLDVPNGPRTQQLFQNIVSSGECGAFCGAPSQVGMLACCSAVPRPGLEASLAFAAYEFDNDGDGTSIACDGLGGTMVGSYCEYFPGRRVTGSCYWSNSNTCPDDYVASGTRCTGKYCSVVQKYCCRLSNLP